MTKTTTHNKLVRDNVPTNLRQAGFEVDVEEIVDKVGWLRLLLDKLELTAQDAALVIEDELLEELANLESVIDQILKLKGLSRADLKQKQEILDNEGGSFSKGYFLKTTSGEGE